MVPEWVCEVRFPAKYVVCMSLDGDETKAAKVAVERVLDLMKEELEQFIQDGSIVVNCTRDQK